MQKLKQIIIHSSPFALGIVLTNLFWRSNIVLLIVYAVIVLLFIVFGKDKKVESLIFLYGVCAAFAVEIIGTQAGGYQRFVHPDALGIPYWLPIAWGYGFILMKRIGLIIGTNSPWVLPQQKL